MIWSLGKTTLTVPVISMKQNGSGRPSADQWRLPNWGAGGRHARPDASLVSLRRVAIGLCRGVEVEQGAVSVEHAQIDPGERGLR
jgi:hypothetical protein